MMIPNANQGSGAATNNEASSIPTTTKQEQVAHMDGTNASGQELTKERLEYNNSNYNHGTTFCQQISKAINCQQAGRELNIDLPIDYYMPQKFQLNEWVKQQAV